MGFNSRPLVWAALAASLAGIGCATEEPARAASCEQTQTAVLSVARGLIAADNAQDLASVLDHYADDIAFITPEGDLVGGKEAIRPRYEGLFREFVVDIRMESEEVGLGGEWAFVRGRNLGTLTSRASGAIDRLDDRFLMILRCQPQGGWKVSRLMWVRAG